MDKTIENIYTSLYDISQIDEPLNLETKDGIEPTRKLNIIYFNLLWKAELKLPKIESIKNLLILLEYFYNKFNDIRKVSPYLIGRKTEIYYLLIERILKLDINKNDKKVVKNLEQYFCDKEFFSCFLKILNSKNNSVFKEKFLFFSRVSL